MEILKKISIKNVDYNNKTILFEGRNPKNNKKEQKEIKVTFDITKIVTSVENTKFGYFSIYQNKSGTKLKYIDYFVQKEKDTKLKNDYLNKVCKKFYFDLLDACDNYCCCIESIIYNLIDYVEYLPKIKNIKDDTFYIDDENKTQIKFNEII